MIGHQTCLRENDNLPAVSDKLRIENAAIFYFAHANYA